MPQPNAPSHVFCNNDSLLSQALLALTASSILFLDCEADALGEKGGTLSIITLRTAGSESSSATTYLIDAYRLSSTALQPIYDLLESPTVPKVVFDGRMDYSALYHDHNVTLKNALDLQLADISSRRPRGEKRYDQLKRLWKFIGRKEVEKHKGEYAEVQKLCGLRQCLEEHKISGVAKVDYQVQHDCWLQRPLPKAYKRYAAADVLMIHELYDTFVQRNFIPTNLIDQSERYISMWRGRQPADADAHLRHPLLPLGILDVTLSSQSNATTRACACCRRSLPQKAFSSDGWRLPSSQRPTCWVCRAIEIKYHGRQETSSSQSQDYPTRGGGRNGRRGRRGVGGGRASGPSRVSQVDEESDDDNPRSMADLGFYTAEDLGLSGYSDKMFFDGTGAIFWDGYGSD